MSALEYQTKSGKIDLSHLKRKNKKKDVEKPLKPLTEEDKMLKELVKMSAPTNLAPIAMKTGKKILP